MEENKEIENKEEEIVETEETEDKEEEKQKEEVEEEKQKQKKTTKTKTKKQTIAEKIVEDNQKSELELLKLQVEELTREKRLNSLKEEFKEFEFLTDTHKELILQKTFNLNEETTKTETEAFKVMFKEINDFYNKKIEELKKEVEDNTKNKFLGSSYIPQNVKTTDKTNVDFNTYKNMTTREQIQFLKTNPELAKMYNKKLGY